MTQILYFDCKYLIYPQCENGKISQSNRYYENINGLLTVTPLKRTWSALCSGLFHFNNPIPDRELINEECQVFYSKYQMENLAWTVSLALMSWVLRNFQRKITNGHCNNTATHDHGEREPRDCDQGRAFHRNMLTDVYNHKGRDKCVRPGGTAARSDDGRWQLNAITCY